MSDLISEQLSAFFDGELPPEEVSLSLKRLEKEDELKATWSRYHLFGDVIRQGEVVCHYPKLNQSIGMLEAAIVDDASVVTQRRRTALRQVWWIGGVIAVLIVLATTLIPMLPSVGSSEEQTVGLATERLGANALVKVDGDNETAVIDEWQELSPEMQSRLSEYIMNYGNYSSSERMAGMNPGFVRMVAYER